MQAMPAPSRGHTSAVARWSGNGAVQAAGPRRRLGLQSPRLPRASPSGERWPNRHSVRAAAAPAARLAYSGGVTAREELPRFVAPMLARTAPCPPAEPSNPPAASRSSSATAGPMMSADSSSRSSCPRLAAASASAGSDRRFGPKLRSTAHATGRCATRSCAISLRSRRLVRVETDTRRPGGELAQYEGMAKRPAAQPQGSFTRPAVQTGSGSWSTAGGTGRSAAGTNRSSSRVSRGARARSGPWLSQRDDVARQRP
jgi:hypothetical protein